MARPNALTTTQMQRLDQLAQRRYGLPVLLLMENAGRAVAGAARQLLRARHGKIIAVCGGGNNGGDGVVAARYLHGWGYLVKVFWLKNPTLWDGDLATHYRIAKRCGVSFKSFRRIPPRRRVSELRKADLLIDALLGIGTVGLLRVPFFDAIAAMNASRKPIVAVDLPSGLDPDAGRPTEIAVKARVTVTMAVPKKGLLARHARRFVGKLVVADIGIPQALLPKK